MFSNNMLYYCLLGCKGLTTLSEALQSSVFLFLHHKEVSDPNFLVPANIAMSLFLSDHFHDVFKL